MIMIIQVGLCFSTLVGHLTVAMYKVELADYHHCYRDYDDDDDYDDYDDSDDDDIMIIHIKMTKGTTDRRCKGLWPTLPQDSVPPGKQQYIPMSKL